MSRLTSVVATGPRGPSCAMAHWEETVTSAHGEAGLFNFLPTQRRHLWLLSTVCTWSSGMKAMWTYVPYDHQSQFLIPALGLDALYFPLTVQVVVTLCFLNSCLSCYFYVITSESLNLLLCRQNWPHNCFALCWLLKRTVLGTEILMNIILENWFHSYCWIFLIA
jgi:hypothetical protein